MHKLRKLLIANRGEIARRVIRSAHALGISTVAVYSDADVGAPHVREADEAAFLGGAPAAESYLSIDRLIDACRRVGADAIHPGYGFLSENAELASRVAEAGLVLVGPPADAIALMGDKARARRRMADAGIPCVPGYDGADQSEATLAAEAARIGFPLLVKAAAGGGGRGMRVVRDSQELSAALASARSESTSAFGRGDLILERLVEGARHVEVQVFADEHGGVVHLGERDCSAQRRYQKIIEESPSPAVDSSLRDKLGSAAVAVAEAINYVGAGTVEFLLGRDGAFYFMEMNTRLQVEHPVTELRTGIDLVAWQLTVAEGAPLPCAQRDIRFAGHAIEARIYAEDPARGFLPQTGRVVRWRPSDSPGVRVDDGIREGQTVTDYYDPLLAKIIAHGESRERARRRLVRAIRESVLLGVGTNRAFLVDLLESEPFVAGAVETTTVDARLPELTGHPQEPDAAVAALASILVGLGTEARPMERPEAWSTTGAAGWTVELEGASGDAPTDGAFASGGSSLVAHLRPVGASGFVVSLRAARKEQETHEIPVTLLERRAELVRFEVDGIVRSAAIGWDGAVLHLDLAGRCFTFRRLVRLGTRERRAAADGAVRAPLGGRVIALVVAEGDRVEPGQCLLVIEAMKMEHRVLAPTAGVVAELPVREGDQIAAALVVARIRPDREVAES